MGSVRTPRNLTEAWDKFMITTLDYALITSRTYDDYYFKQKFRDWKTKRLRYVQKLDMQNQQKLGSDLSIANFAIRYCRGQVRDARGNWLNRFRQLPTTYVPSFKVTGLDVSNSGLITECVDNFVGLDYLEYLNISRNEKLDDFFCDQFSRLFRASSAFNEINVSYNSRISIYGLEALMRIPSLKRIEAIGTPAADHDEVELFKLAALDEKGCEVVVKLDQIESK